MTKEISSYINLFTDNAKLLRKIRNHKNCEVTKSQTKYMNYKKWKMEVSAKEKTTYVLEMGKCEI